MFSNPVGLADKILEAGRDWAPTHRRSNPLEPS
jgi:hypothetical protein